VKRDVPAWAAPAAIFAFFGAFYLLFRSNDFFAVDGSFRCLEVYRYPTLFFRSNNHLFYTPNVLWWVRGFTALGYTPRNPVDFLRLVEVMNCLAGAAALAVFASLLLAATDSVGIALVGTAGLGLTRSFLAQATNSNEPMLGILWSFGGMALAVASARRKSFWLAAGSGFLFGLAMATYRSMVLLAPAAGVPLLLANEEGAVRFVFAKARFGRAVLAAITGAVCAVALHGWAYWVMGERSIVRMAASFFATEGSDIYLGLRWSRAASLPIGLARNLFAVEPEYTTFPSFLARPLIDIAWLFFLVGVSVAFLIFCAVMIAKHWSALRPGTQAGAVAALVGLAFTFPPLLVWDPQYDKLWAQPLACMIFLAAIAVSIVGQPGRRARIALWCFAVAAVGGMSVALHWAYQKHVHEPYEFDEAREAAALFGKNDFVVGDWRPTAMLYGYLWAEPGQFLSFPSEATEHREGVLQQITEGIDKARAKGGHAYFFGTLDVPKSEWNDFFGSECGIPYSALNEYRKQATPLTRYRDRHGYDVLWELK